MILYCISSIFLFLFECTFQVVFDNAGDYSASRMDSVMLKFRQLEKQELEDKQDDVYSKSYVPKKYDKSSNEYGRPKPGTLTEKRAQKASAHIAGEMLYLCEVIQEYGYISKEDNKIKIKFGRLFNVYQFISDKVVGILLRARKHGMVAFDGEMLFQRRDDDVIITVMLSEEELKTGLENHRTQNAALLA